MLEAMPQAIALAGGCFQQHLDPHASTAFVNLVQRLGHALQQLAAGPIPPDEQALLERELHALADEHAALGEQLAAVRALVGPAEG